MTSLLYSLLLVTTAVAFRPLLTNISIVVRNKNRLRRSSPTQSIKVHQWSSLFANKQESFTSSTASRDVFVLSYDGVVASTIRQRSTFALEVALNIWPHLRGIVSSDIEWLINKMEACAYVTRNSNDSLLGCDEVLLARLLLEEQLLDEGRSVGKTGKYASKFHRTSADASEGTNVARENGNGSRPLTVGEICANWINGGCLRDTLRTRYNIERKDPIPIIREEIKTRLEKKVSNL